MLLLLGAFIAGLLTALAPCVLPLLPVIIGGSISGNVSDKKRPLIIAASLAVSLILFTVLLKATTLFIDVPPEVFTYISGGILIILGIAFLFPNLYESIIEKLNIQAKSQQLLGKAGGKKGLLGPIAIGAALGPVFSSCSPVYAYVLATILPVNFGLAMLYIFAYVLGLSVMLLAIGYLGQRFVKRLKFATNPRGWFNRVIAILFIIVGLLVITGFDKKFQTYVADKTPFDFDAISSQLIPTQGAATNGEILNVEEPYNAPEFTGLENWVNSEPLQLSDLRGKVVLVDFWTYSCINCIRTQPYLKAWYETYKDSDFVIVGVHAPEFAFERKPENVEKAARKAGLEYPIALDNNFATWNAYSNQYWPAHYLIDKEGKVRRTHSGEGEYKEMEQAIRTLIQEDGGTVPSDMSNPEGNGTVRDGQTPETYLGSRRATNYAGEQALTNGTRNFSGTPSKVNEWTLYGEWTVDGEGITAGKDASLTLRFAAKEVYLVPAEEGGGKKMTVLLNDKPIKNGAGSDVKNSMVTVTAPELYRLVELDKFEKDNTLTLEVPAGIKLNVFTFGG